MNGSTLSRKEQVLKRLTIAHGEWVDGAELATAECGGSEGLKRLRELRAEGHRIEERRHPDPGRSQWQYRLAPYNQKGWTCPRCKSESVMPLAGSFSPRVMFGECPKHGKTMFTRND